MKKIFITVLIFLALPLAARASTVLGDISTGNGAGKMVGYWPLNEGKGTLLRDQSGGSNTAALVGSPTWVTSGKFAGALQFGGSPQVASTTLAWPSSGSISVWVYPTSYADWISPTGWKVLGTSHNGYALIDEGGSGSPGRWRAVFGPTGDAAELDIVALQTITQNTWQHVVMTWSKSGNTYTVDLYVNGTLQGTGTWTGATTPNIGHFHFGNSGDYPDNYFLGRVDDVRVYNYALTPAQVSVIYKVGTPATIIGHSSTVTLSSGLVGYWPLDGNTINWSTGKVSDLSGSGNTGSLILMSTTTSPVAGKIGSALKFSSAAAQEISLGTAPAPLAFAYNQPFTISLWARASATVGSGVYDRMVSITATSGKFEYFMMANNSTFSFNVGKNGIGDASVAASTFTVGQWYHVVGVYDGTNISLYINGVKIGSAAYTYGALSSPDGILSIGGGGSAGNTFNGSLDDVRIYNRALSASEVAQLYTNGGGVIAHSNTSALSSGLVGYWPLDGNTTNWTSGVTKDISGSTNNGLLLSMSTSTSPVAGKVGQALKFDGLNSEIRIPDAASLNPSTVTVSAWIYSTGSNPSAAGERIVDKANASTITQNGYRFAAFSTANCGSTNPKWGMQWYNGSAQLLCGPDISSTSGKWTQLVFTHDGTTGRIYMNGVLVNSVTTAYTGINTFNLAIGNSDQVNRAFSGKIDDVRIYNRALSASEVAQLYASTK